MLQLLSTKLLNIQRAILISIAISSCVIEDEHGTARFIAGLDEHNTRHGEILTDYFVEREILVSRQNKLVFFLGCPPNERWCENESLVSLNLETGEETVLFTGRNNSWLILLPNQPLEQRLIFAEQNTNNNQAYLHATDLKTFQGEIVLTLNANETRITSNQQYIIHNDGYESGEIYLSDFNGNTNNLMIEGEVLYAIPNSSKVLIIEYSTYQLAIYDFTLRKLDIKEGYGVYSTRFFAYGDNLFSLDEGGGNLSIKNFYTNEIITVVSQPSIFLDFDPVSRQVLYMKDIETPFDRGFALYANELHISDAAGNDMETGVRVFDESISFGRLINNGKTIIYNSEGKLYISSIE